MRCFTLRLLLWLVVGLACVVTPILFFADYDSGTGLLLAVSIAALLVVGFWDRDFVTTLCFIVTVTTCLEVAIQVGWFVMEWLVLMLGGFLMTLLGGQLRQAWNCTELAWKPRTVAR
jgi:hypothetical protein